MLLQEKLQKHISLVKAQNLKVVRRFEDAAKIYEKLGLYSEAGKTRAKGEEVKVKKIEVSVDLNSLLEQVKDGGIAVVYRCPHCNGKLKVGKSSNIESLKSCGYCGSEIQTIEIADLLRTALE